jgi:hypothetical protein
MRQIIVLAQSGFSNQKKFQWERAELDAASEP